jgi:hypothetical protein
MSVHLEGVCYMQGDVMVRHRWLRPSRLRSGQNFYSMMA